MLKIILVANTSWNIYNFRAGLVNFLLSQGYKIYILAPKDAYTEKIQAWNVEYREIILENKGTNPLKDLAFHRQLLRIYRQIQPDVVLHFTIKPNIYGTLACYRLKIPCINNVSGLGTTFLHKNFASRIAHFLYRLAFRFASKVFFQNAEDRTLFIQKKLVKPEISDLLPGSGVNLEKFAPMPSTAKENFVFLMIARLIYDKGVREFVEACKIVKKQYPKAIFRLLGDFEDNPENPLNITPQEVEIWQNDVEYLGKKADVRPYIAEADVVVLPSYREGTPRSLLEAAAMAKPLIATNVAGCKEVVKNNENGFLCKARSAESLAQAMIRMLLLSEKERQEMGANSRKLVETHFDEKIVFEKYILAIQEILKAKN
jgi:glycosyltransferase involved in cell wall biosynthesis